MNKLSEQTELKGTSVLSKSAVERCVIGLKCWWFGCEPDIDNAYGYDPGDGVETAMPCKRCHKPDILYSDLVGETRHQHLKEKLRYWLFRKWWPKKCGICGNRFKECDWDREDHIPF